MEFKNNQYFSQLASQRLTTLVSGGRHSVASGVGRGGAPAPEHPPFADELIYYFKVFIK